MYYNIDIDHRNSVTISQISTKRDSALFTLQKIERIIKGKLEYDERNDLRAIAHTIKANFLKKSAKVGAFRRFFSNVAKKEQEVVSLYNKIKEIRLTKTPALLGLISSYLTSGETAAFAQTDRAASKAIDYVARAKKYGYKGKDQKEAHQYLEKLYEGMHFLYSNGFISKKYFILDKRGKIDFDRSFEKLQDPNIENLNEILWEAVARKNESAVWLLIMLGADPTPPFGKQEESAFILAIRKKNTEIIRLFLFSEKCKDKLNIRKGIFSALKHDNSLEVIKMFIDAGCSIKDVFLDACHHSRDDVVEYILNAEKSELTQIDLEKGLVKAINKCSKIVKRLLNVGINPNTLISGKHPLIQAIESYDFQATKLLLQAGVDPNIGLTKALTRDRFFVDLLVSHGAIISKTIIHDVIKLNNNHSDIYGIIEYLLNKGTDINERLPDGDTPLHTAYKYDRHEIIGFLVLHGAKPGLCNNKGRLPGFP